MQGVNLTQEYQLECPACLVRFHLKKHIPGKRIRCRKCRKIMTIPPLPGVHIKKSEITLPPEHRKVLKTPLHLKLLGIVVPLLLLAVGSSIALLLNRVDIQKTFREQEKKEGQMTFEKWNRERLKSPFPLAIGYQWKYKGEGDVAEERRVISSHLAPTTEPQFEYTVTDPIQSARQLLRATNDGVLLLEEKNLDGDEYRYDPPLLVVPRPIYLESKWTYQGKVIHEDNREEWDLTFLVQKSETITTPVGTFNTLRVQVSGVKGDLPVEETIWYALGSGVVQTRKILGQTTTTFTISELSRPGK